MNRKLCVCHDFLTEAHRAQIIRTAAETGFTPLFFRQDQLDDLRAQLADCEVLYADAPALLREAPALKWYCASSAGADVYCKDPTLFANPGCLLTSSNVYGTSISEHVIMVLLLLLRRMPEYGEIIRRREWVNSLPIRSIQGASFYLLGTGDIGRHVADRLRGMGAAQVIGISRSGKADPAHFDAVYPTAQLDALLPQAHQLILSLPDTPETRGILSREQIALLPKDALVVNVGRGTAVDQEALLDALTAGSIGGAALDVVVPEPLPAGHPLWSAPNLILTPHLSGKLTLAYTQDQNVALFCENLRRYAAGQPLAHLVDRSRGY